MTALAWAESLGFELGQAIARGVQRGLVVVPAATLRPRTAKRRAAPRVARADVSTPRPVAPLEAIFGEVAGRAALTSIEAATPPQDADDAEEQSFIGMCLRFGAPHAH